jgi:RimJ/RimL family protein N-acetyltransferase
MPITEIETARLYLRPVVMNDLDAMYRIWTEPEVKRYLWDDQTIPKDKAEEALRTSIQSFEVRGYGLWAMVYKQTHELIGFCGFRLSEALSEVELLYSIASNWRGAGLTTEAAQAVLQWGFEQAKFERIVATANPENEASWRVLEKLRMRREKTMRMNDEEVFYYVIEA